MRLYIKMQIITNNHKINFFTDITIPNQDDYVNRSKLIIVNIMLKQVLISQQTHHLNYDSCEKHNLSLAERIAE